MNKLHTIFLTIVTILCLFITVGSFFTKVSLPGQILRLLLIPTTFYLAAKLTSHLTSSAPALGSDNVWLRLLTFYSLIVSSIFILAGIMGSRTSEQLITSLIFSPIAIYFFVTLWPQKSLVTASYQPYRSRVQVAPEKLDEDKRDFLKMLGAAGLSVLLLNLFSRRTLDYLPVLNPSSNSKQPTDEQISVATKSPTAGYFISQIDDSSPAYFGFTNSLGQWYIMREESGNEYRYSKGDKEFVSNWSHRANLKYDYFENVF